MPIQNGSLQISSPPPIKCDSPPAVRSNWTNRKRRMPSYLNSTSCNESTETTHRQYGTAKTSNTSKLSPRYNYVAIVLAGMLLLLLCNAFFLVLQLPSSSRSDIPSASRRRQTNNNFQHFQGDGITTSQNHDTEEGQLASLLTGEWNEQQLLDKLNQWENMIAHNLSLQQEGQLHLAAATSQVTSCRKIDCTNLQTREKHFRVAFYNPLDQARIVCGRKLEPHSLLVLEPTDQPCAQQPFVHSTLFPELPTRHNQQTSSLIPPIRLGIKGVRPSRSVRFRPFPKCDVKCQYINDYGNIPAIARTVEGTNWEIVTSMEGPVYYKSLLDPPPLPLANSNMDGTSSANLPNHRFFATTSLDSDIPLPYFSWDEYAPNRTAAAQGVDYDKAIKGAVFMARNCHSTNNREALVLSLIKLSQTAHNSSLVRIDSISSCLKNHEPPPTVHRDDKMEIMSQYLFYLALENQDADDHITEKLWGSLFGSGAVPVYHGAPNIHDCVPPHSIIHVRDFPDAAALWNHLNQVAANRTLYESYHDWRKQPLPEAFIRRYNFTQTHSLCRMCRWAFAKRYGWGWNHKLQTIDEEDTLLHQRRLCWDKTTGLLTHPFWEQWRHSDLQEMVVDKDHTMCTTSEGEDKGDHECEEPDQGLDIQNALCEAVDSTGTPRTRSVTLANGSFRRTVWTHDGFLDISLERIWEVTRSTMNIASSLILELQLPPFKDDATPNKKSSWNIQSHTQFWIQKGSTRFTILASRAVVLSTPKSGVVQLSVSFKDQQQTTVRAGDRLFRSDETIRLRCFLEQVDPSEKDDHGVSYFANLAIIDFLSPVERFLVEDIP